MSLLSSAPSVSEASWGVSHVTVLWTHTEILSAAETTAQFWNTNTPERDHHDEWFHKAEIYHLVVTFVIMKRNKLIIHH